MTFHELLCRPDIALFCTRSLYFKAHTFFFFLDMHRVFQRDLCKLRLSTARAYVKVISDGQGPVANTGGSARLTARVMGVGPIFKIILSLKNTGKLPLINIPIAIYYNVNIYKVQRSSFHVSYFICES